MKKLLAVACVFALSVNAQTNTSTDTKELGTITVISDRPTSLPSQIPTTMEGIKAEQIAQSINATDSADALKYFPSLLVRKRYVGDYNHAILSSRASGTGNSARSAVYADGILLSNYLGNGVGGLSFPPRWGMVTPEEIERVDVMYGPFSAAYPGNSVGAVVDYVTRMPTQFEAHGKAGFSSQFFNLYNTQTTYNGWESSTSVGNKNGDFAWWLDFSRTDSNGQPLTFATRTVSNGNPGATGTAVSGAVSALNANNTPIYVIAAGTQYHTKQDHVKAKFAYDISPELRLSYLLGWWQNTSEGNPTSYLTNAAGKSVSSGVINIGGASYAAMTGADMPLTRESQVHFMHGLSLKSHTKGEWDWEVAGSLYDYSKDDKRQNAATNTYPAAFTGGAGTLANGAGTGWNNLALRGTWRPQGLSGAHIADFGYQQDNYKLQYLTSNITGNWLSDPAGADASNIAGQSHINSVYAQDAWRFADKWKTVLGWRYEQWRANGSSTSGVNPAVDYGSRQESYSSPKAALSYQLREDAVVKASLARAVRFPTVSELYGATATPTTQYVNDPYLRPERSVTGELTHEKYWQEDVLRLTYFVENTLDGLYSQSLLSPVNPATTITRVQNVGRVATQGIEAAYNGVDVELKGVDANASLTYTNSVIKENNGFVTTPGDTIGKQQPNIPHWRASALLTYRWSQKLNTSLGARYSSMQYRTLNNSGVNGYAYQGVSPFFVVDARLRYQITKTANEETHLALGIDNLNNYTYWNFHPYPQRTLHAELRVDWK